MKLRRENDKSALMLMVNTILFGVGAGLVVLAWTQSLEHTSSTSELFEAAFNLEQPLLLITVAILLAGVFHSFTILYPTLLQDREEKRKALQDVSEFRDQAYRDPLTGLFNRRYFDEIYHAYFEEFAKVNLSFGLLVFDIDHFKRINDTYGHAAGDEVLREIARCILSMIRDNDVVARIGGEEFAVMLAYVNERQLMSIADRFRERIEVLDVKFEGKTLRPTISLGAVLSANQQDTVQMMRNADECLYEAKNKGRNRVISRLNNIAA